MRAAQKKGFTLVELLVVISIIALLVGILLPALSRARKSAQNTRCAANLNQIHKGLVGWSSSDRDRYPEAQRLDTKEFTEQHSTFSGANPDRTKNRTGNIYSLLIFTGNISREIPICSAEVNTNIRTISEDQYYFKSPPGTPNPTYALYDPAFRGTVADYKMSGTDTFTGRTAGSNMPFDGVGNASYAHIPISGDRRTRYWNSIFANATTPIFSDRGPKFVGNPGTQRQPAGGEEAWAFPAATPATGSQSDSLRIHGSQGAWAGNVVYNDSHVNFENAANPKELIIKYAETNPALCRDNLFADEPDGRDAGGIVNQINNVNSYLRMWKYGPKATPTNITEYGSVVLDSGSPSDVSKGVWIDGQTDSPGS